MVRFFMNLALFVHDGVGLVIVVGETVLVISGCVGDGVTCVGEDVGEGGIGCSEAVGMTSRLTAF